MRFLPIAVLFLVLVTELSFGQSFYAIRRERSLMVTVGSGSANYFGELVNPGSLGKIRPNLVLGAEYYFFNRISARTELTWFMIAGDDAKANSDRVERNLNFFSNNFELSATGAVYLLPNGVRFYQRPILNLYGFAGIGLLYFNPKTRYQGDVVALAPLETEGTKYSRVIPVIPFGLGVKIKYGPFFNIIVEGGYRLTFSDYLDDVSITRYPDPASLKSDLSRALSDRRRERDPDYPIVPGLGRRGNPETNDGYILLNVKVQYYLPVDFGSSQRKLYNQKRKQYKR
ncbi:MAG: hypothetical protein JNK18_14015 [Cyclobacteriaceae bacterium]|nr:hypothetical protein [Cyclobacteriaceae bacterium]